MKDWKRLKQKLTDASLQDISSDTVHHADDELLVTSFAPGDSRNGVATAVSFCFLKRGWQVTAKFDKDGAFKYWYCDIVEFQADPAERTLTIVDLAADIVVHPDMYVSVMDLDELGALLEGMLLPPELAVAALRRAQELLTLVYRGGFPPEEVEARFPDRDLWKRILDAEP